MDFSVFAVVVLMFIASGCGGDANRTVAGSPVNSSPITEVPTPPSEPEPDPAPDLPPVTGNPDLGTALAVGFYSDGSLKYAEEFPDTGVGFYKLFLPRDRGWSTRSLINIVAKAAADVLAQIPNGARLQIGDAGLHNGGYASGHASHQNGLDVDLRYYSVNRAEQSPNTTSGFNEQFVSSGKVTSNFDMPRNWLAIKSMVGSGKVSRIFVDPAIKSAFCGYPAAAGQTEVFRRLIPYANHGNHMHVRIKCPTNSPNCVAQSEVSSGSGCGSVTAQTDEESAP